MTIYEYGNPDADTVLIQLTGDHELSVLKNEVEEIRKRTSTDFRLIAAKVDDWNYELSPWKAPAVFGNEDFGDVTGWKLYPDGIWVAHRAWDQL